MLPSAFPEVTDYPSVRELLEKQVNMQFHDLRSLLRLPMREQGLHSGANLTTTVLLCNILAGASVLFWRSSVGALKPASDRGQRFEELMTAHYPWCEHDAERDGAGARLLWRSARSPLTHALGVGKSYDLFPGAPGNEKPVALAKSVDGLPDGETVERLLALETRPDWFERDATISLEGPEYVVSVEMLAWGAHRLLHSLFADEAQMYAAERTARELLRGSAAPTIP